MELITGKDDEGRRLDRILRKALPSLPLSMIHRLLRQGQVLVNGKTAKPQDRLDSGVEINIQYDISQDTAPTVSEKPPKKTKEPVKNNHSLEILWQNEGLIAVNKPVGLEIHGKDSLNSLVSSYLEGKLPPSLSFKSGPLHRLDKPTSGIVIFSKSLEGAQAFSSLMREKKVKKTYLAVVEGIINKEQQWENTLIRDKTLKKTFISGEKGADAVTIVKPLAHGKENDRDYTLINAEIATGRTHQIRVQAASAGHPLAGDGKYGGARTGSFKNGFFLHAWKIKFLGMSIEAPLPMAFQEIVKEIFRAKEL